MHKILDTGCGLLILFIIRQLFKDEEQPTPEPDKCTKSSSLLELIDAIQIDPEECHQEAKVILKGVLWPMLLLSIVLIFIIMCILFTKICARVPEKPQLESAIKLESATTSRNENIPKRVSTVRRPTPHRKLSIYTVHVVTSFDACQEFMRQIRRHCEDFPVVGFDCKWWSIKGPRRKVALLQLASAGGLCILVRLCQMDSLPIPLVDLLRDDCIIKVGVQPLDDGLKLQHDYGLKVNSTLDLRHLARRLNVPRPYKLATLAKRVLKMGLKMDPYWRLPASNWEVDELTACHIEYASKNAIAGLEIFRVFSKEIPMSEMTQVYDLPFEPETARVDAC